MPEFSQTATSGRRYRERDAVQGSNNGIEKVGFPCPRQLKPLLHFYKYLQPLPDGRRLQLNLPITVVCEKKEGIEELLWLSSDSHGCIMYEEKGTGWRKRIQTDIIQAIKNSQDIDMDEVIAIRNMAHWKGHSNNKSIVLTRRTFDPILNAPSDLAFSIQQFIRCRGSHPSIFRVTWGERESRRCAINIASNHKRQQVANMIQSQDQPQGTALDIALKRMEQLTPYYCVTSTSDPKHCKLPKIRGNPIVECTQAVKRIVDHFMAHLPGLRVRELTADFIKDNDGKWWYIRTVHFDAYYKVEIPIHIQERADDSAVFIPRMLRSKYFRQALRASPVMEPENCMTPNCSLCLNSCDLNRVLKQELQAMVPTDDQDVIDFFKAMSEYRMTYKMASTTIYQLRQRGIILKSWENALLFIQKTPGVEFTVCYLCYQVYKAHMNLSRITMELHEVYGIPCSDLIISEDSIETEDELMLPSSRVDVDQRLTRIYDFQSQPCISPQQTDLIIPSVYKPLCGLDLDPTSLQMRLVFFFHELQDGGSDLTPTDFYLEYHIGQQLTRLDFDGSKIHTPNRWQLCEAKVHYLLSTKDGFSLYCSEHQLLIHMKTKHNDQVCGSTILSLRPILSSSKWFNPSIQMESRTDYLLEVQTTLYGLLTLKLTLGLLVHTVPFSQIRDTLKHMWFLQEIPISLYWPPPSFQITSLIVPVDWIGALMPSEYVSVVPIKSRAKNQRRRQGVRSTISIQSTVPTGILEKSPSRRFSLETRQQIETMDRTESYIASGDSPSVQKPLMALVIASKRLMYRIAGEVTSFPTIVLATILRYSCFLSAGNTNTAPWAQPATFYLTQRFTIDQVFADIRSVSIPSLALFGELLLVLLHRRFIPPLLVLDGMEVLVAPYWVGLEPFEMLSHNSCYSSRQRMIWNQALRRCEVTHFCAGFRCYRSYVLERDAPGLSSLEHMRLLQRKMTYRSKLQGRWLCEIFEQMEGMDSGYIEIAELRSLAKSYPCIESNSFQEIGTERIQVDRLALVLTEERQVTVTNLLLCLMESRHIQDVLNQFDQLGCGELNFDEFWRLAEEAMDQMMLQRNAEAIRMGFCLRHGSSTAYALDGLCLKCSKEYLDQALVTWNHQLAAPVSSDDEDDDEEEENESDEDEEETHLVEPKSDPVVSTEHQDNTTSNNNPAPETPSEILHEGELQTMMEKLEAAEWHILHREGSVTQEVVMTSRRNSTLGRSRSIISTVPQTSRSIRNERSSVVNISEFVHDAEVRKSTLLPAIDHDDQHHPVPLTIRSDFIPQEKKQVVEKKKKKKKKLKKPTKIITNSVPKARLATSRSLSALLQTEFDNTFRRQNHQRDVDELIEQVRRVETKRKKLDRLVLNELEDVKARLARLMHST